MNVWIPGLIVVAVGLAAGLWFALRTKQEGTESSQPGGVGVPVSAAGVSRRPDAERSEGVPAPAERRSGLVGFLFGVGTCLVVGALVYWATQGARPKDEMSPGGAAPPPMAQMAPTAPMAQTPRQGAASPADADAAHEEAAELTPEVAAELQQFRAQVQASPQDLTARRQLTVALLNANLLMEAFEQAKELQKVAPNDADGLFVEGVVRLAMGQWPLTVQLMDGVLAQHPDHVLAALAKGQAEAALGQTSQAIATWKKGLAAAGGRFPPIEELLAAVEAGGGPAAEAAPEPPATIPAVGAGGGTYRVHIELAPGTVGTRGADGSGATLFVALRGDTPGPPAAAKRISNPAFPIELTLSVADSMMGQPLPEKGSLSIHLDGDGNASTKEAGDLTAAVQAFSGTPITVILESAAQ